MIKLKDIYEDVFKRKDMPQVKTSDLNKAIDLLGDKGIQATSETCSCNRMKPSQKDVDKDKVRSIASKLKGTDVTKMKPIVISDDDHIVDGHHRYLALQSLGYYNTPIPVIRIALMQTEAIDAYKEIEEKLGD